MISASAASVGFPRYDMAAGAFLNACPVLPPVADGIPPAVSTGAGRAPFTDCGTPLAAGRTESGRGCSSSEKPRARRVATGPQSPNSPVRPPSARPATTSVGAKGVLLKGVVLSAFMTGLPRFFKHAAMAKKFAPNK